LPLPDTVLVFAAAPLPLPLVAFEVTDGAPPFAEFVLLFAVCDELPPVGLAVTLPEALPAEALWLFETETFCAAPSAPVEPCEIELVGVTPTDTLALGLLTALFVCTPVFLDDCELRVELPLRVFCAVQVEVAEAPEGGCSDEPFPDPVAELGQLLAEVGAPTAAEGKIKARASAPAERPAPALRRIVPELFCMGCSPSAKQ
jgi:hypothetical protein